MKVALDRSDDMQNTYVDRLQSMNSFCKRSPAIPSSCKRKYVDEMYIKTIG